MQVYEWKPIEEAPKDGTIVWAVFKDDIYPTIKPEREDLKPWNGVQAPIRYLGDTLLWSIAIPVGHGGFPDVWFDGWMPLPMSLEQIAIQEWVRKCAQRLMEKLDLPWEMAKHCALAQLQNLDMDLDEDPIAAADEEYYAWADSAR